jgi:hypothetical protein
MAIKPKNSPPPAEPEGPLYPAIEAFIETGTADEVAALFEPIKDGLENLKGPKAEQSKKVRKAIEKTEELLAHLLQVREKLEAEEKSGGSRR